MTMEKKTAAVIFGGQSSEHVVSCMSAANVIDRINTDKYNLILIGITQEGKWLKVDSVQAIRDESWRKGTVSAAILPDAEKKCALFMENGTMTEVKLDVVFPVLHGLCGEDGTIQGLLELAKIPYVGCGVLASAVSMDKLYTKIIVDELGIRQAAYVPVMKEQLEDMNKVVNRIEGRFAYPVFIKPSNAGSSKGVSKADNREELEAGLTEAACHDRIDGNLFYGGKAHHGRNFCDHMVRRKVGAPQHFIHCFSGRQLDGGAVGKAIGVEQIGKLVLGAGEGLGGKILTDGSGVQLLF